MVRHSRGPGAEGPKLRLVAAALWTRWPRLPGGVSALSLYPGVPLPQVETGNPYMLYKDTCNRKSNQQNLGTIKCSNLCTEIMEYTSADETAVCNLASIALPRFVRDGSLEGRRVKLVGSLGAANRHAALLLGRANPKTSCWRAAADSPVMQVL